MILPRIIVVLGVAIALVGCSASPEASPSPSPLSTAELAAQCADAAAGIVDAVEAVVAEYEEPAVSPTATPEPAPTQSADTLADAVEAARLRRDELGCDPEAFAATLEAGLAAVAPGTPIAEAIWRRASASILGTLRTEAGEWILTAEEDIRDAVARAAEGTTIVLPEGIIELDSTVVLLQGVTFRGAGRDATTIRSTAPEAALIVATASLVGLEDLTLELAGADPASGLVAGPSASVALKGVRVTGAKAGEAGLGGAGVYLSAEGDEGSGRGTTLEITASVFDRNGWAGVAVAGGHRVSIEESAFTGNGEVGILFLDSSSGSVSASTFADNTVGLAATGAATPTWLSSTVTGGSVGLQMDAAAAPIVDGIRISGSGSAAVIYGGESGGSIANTSCEDVPFGIVVSDAAAPTLGENSCQLARGPS
ncbi:right-handed parallel beta-helix repeat-containing protein [Microbacterium sp. 2FI]|uniref:right-handed parallel beta-helix repeat-containing protein n=1 Tax=Microbacterium sp. 2FI TaxID=2502193 RepID=UPI0010F4E548|nr:right-handed parallel beta-helix repeat-containing protein [Microbacterium sp. 2FI]